MEKQEMIDYLTNELRCQEQQMYELKHEYLLYQLGSSDYKKEEDITEAIKGFKIRINLLREILDTFGIEVESYLVEKVKNNFKVK